MIRWLLLATLVGCSPAAADDLGETSYVPPPEVYFEEESDPATIEIGYIVFHNQLTHMFVGPDELVIETTVGPVVVIHSRTPNHVCGSDNADQACWDTLEVIDTPEGYVVIPAFISAAERSIHRLSVMPFLGG